MTKKPMRAANLSHTALQYHREAPSLTGHDQDSTEEQLFQETRSQRTRSLLQWEHRLSSPSLMCSHLRSHGSPLPRPQPAPGEGKCALQYANTFTGDLENTEQSHTHVLLSAS